VTGIMVVGLGIIVAFLLYARPMRYSENFTAYGLGCGCSLIAGSPYRGRHYTGARLGADCGKVEKNIPRTIPNPRRDRTTWATT